MHPAAIRVRDQEERSRKKRQTAAQAHSRLKRRSHEAAVIGKHSRDRKEEQDSEPALFPSLYTVDLESLILAGRERTILEHGIGRRDPIHLRREMMHLEE